MSKAQVTVRLDKSRLARARKLLSARTSAEAIEKALHDAIVRKYGGVGRKDSFATR